MRRIGPPYFAMVLSTSPVFELVGGAVEHLLDLFGHHRVEVVWRCEHTRHEAGATLTMGFPVLAMMKASPIAGFSISYDRCTFASLILTTFLIRLQRI